MRQFAHKFVCFLSWLLFLSLIPFSAVAQETVPQVTISLLNSDEFPHITFYLDAHDSEGHFVHGLQAEDISVLEDAAGVLLDGVEELRPGVQFVVAVTPGSSFSIRDATGTSRYDYLLQGISSWEPALDGNDDYSLVIPWGSEIAHVRESGRVLAGLSSSVVFDEQTYPDLQILSRALELAANPTPRPGMERAILFITAPQAAEGVIGLQSLAARASELGIRIYVWVLAAPEFFDMPESAPLRAVSGQTGGRFFAFTGSEEVPNLETILEPLRGIYQLSYTSPLTTSGGHQISTLLTIGEQQVNSNELTFEVSLLPPQPVFISPPTLIQRAIPSEADSDQVNGTVIEMLPVEQGLEVMISFPDQYVRPLVRTTLYVDGAIAAENTSPPFDQFTWDLRAYLEGGKHVLQVEAVDSLGMSGVSVEIPVQVEVTATEINILAALLRNKLLITGLAVALAGSVLTLVLLLGGKIRPAHPAQLRKSGKNGKKTPTTRPRRNDPVSQPVPIKPIPPTTEPRKTKPEQKTSPSSSDQKTPSKALAYLTPLAEAGSHTLPAPCPLNELKAVLGSDPDQASILLEDPSVEGVHAIFSWEQGTYRLVDAGSVAGTWVNYAPVSPQGIRLEHGDLIYAGHIGFRFNLREPGRLPRVVVRPHPESDK